MSWVGDRIEKFRQVPNPYFSMHITSKFLGGVGLGVLLAGCLPVWSGWVVIGVAVLIAIPSAQKILRE